MTLLKKKKPVLFAGENHLISLFHPDSDNVLLQSSCWKCSYSEYGEGFVLCVSGDPVSAASSSLVLPSVFTDNLSLAHLVVKRFNQYFEGFQHLGLDTVAPTMASFSQQASGRVEHRITCSTSEINLELVWQDVQDAALEIFYNTSGPVPYDVSAVICHCQQASISINGQRVVGEIHVPSGASASSAFLAFSETWVATGGVDS